MIITRTNFVRVFHGVVNNLKLAFELNIAPGKKWHEHNR